MVFRQHQPHRRNQQHDGEEVGDPVELLQQLHARNDKSRTQHHCAQNAPEQDAALLRLGDTEGLEEQKEDKQVIDGERLFKRVTRQELLPQLVMQAHVDVGGKGDGTRDPHGRRDIRTPRGDGLRGLVQQQDLDAQQHQQQHVEDDPVRNVRVGHRV